MPSKSENKAKSFLERERNDFLLNKDSVESLLSKDQKALFKIVLKSKDFSLEGKIFTLVNVLLARDEISLKRDTLVGKKPLGYRLVEYVLDGLEIYSSIKEYSKIVK